MEITPESVKSYVQASLDRLTTKPDLLLIHSPYVATKKEKIGELWTILEGLVEDGTLEGVSLGVSNFVPHHLEEVLKVAKIKPAAHRESPSIRVLNARVSLDMMLRHCRARVPPVPPHSIATRTRHSR